MNARHVEAIGKLIEAKKLEKEALDLILPEKMKKHVDVICGELKALALELLVDAVEAGQESQSQAKETGGLEQAVASTKVKKVPIG